MTIRELNTATPQQFSKLMLDCCGSERWVHAMLLRRPFRDFSSLEDAASHIWWSLDPADWLEAFSKHPRIGEHANPNSWSADEQSGMNTAGGALSTLMTELNRRYEEKFGWMFIVCATGKTAEQMRDMLENRLTNDSAAEVRVAACEQAMITALRLKKLVTA